jgi:hypothetical protein
MASKTLGRITCPIGCGHTAAQVKLKTDKTSGTAHPYVHCAGCGIQLHTRNEEQAGHLLRNTRAEKGADAPQATQAPPAPENVPAPAKNAPTGIFGLFAGSAA